jgi:hypothetical protein
MPISPTNITKNVISPTNQNKGLGAEWGDLVATWADAFFGWADSEIYVNINKTTLSAFLQLQDGTDFLLQDNSQLELQGGSGTLLWSNVTKN